MSRFETKDKHGNYVAYGLDHALGYFLDIEKGNELILSLSNRGQILDAIEEHGVEVPVEHIQALVLDLPM